METGTKGENCSQPKMRTGNGRGKRGKSSIKKEGKGRESNLPPPQKWKEEEAHFWVGEEEESLGGSLVMMTNEKEEKGKKICLSLSLSR